MKMNRYKDKPRNDNDNNKESDIRRGASGLSGKAADRKSPRERLTIEEAMILGR